VGRKDSGSGALLGLFSAADADNPAAMAALAADGGAASFGADAFDRARAARRALLSAHEQLLGVVEGLRPDVVGALEARLASGAVEPALGLVIANLGLLGVVEAEINGFAPRHRRFYHGEVLGQRPRGAAPETVLLRMVSAGFPAPITEGEQIEARAPGSARPQMFRLLAGVLVSPVEAAEARTLLFERDPDISLQRSLGYVTAVRAAERRIDGADAADARRRLFAPEGQERAALGIEVDSDMLRLREGVRRVEAAFRLRPRAQIAVPPPDAGADAMVEATAAALRADRALHDAFADTGEAKAAQEIAAQAARCDPMMSGRDRLRLACLRCATSPDRLRAVLGAIVAETLVEGGDWPDGAVMAALLERLQTLFEDGSGEGQRIAQAAREWFAKPPTEVYQLFLSGGFAVSFSTAEGFVDAPGARAAPNRAEDGAGFRVRLTLDAAQPPIAPARRRRRRRRRCG